MTYGGVVRGLLLLSLFGAAMPATAQQHRKIAANADTTITLTSIDAQSLQYLRGDGSAGTATITPSSLFLRQGLLAASADFSPGETARLRLRTFSGVPRLVLLADLASAAVIAHSRRRPVRGTIQSISSQALVLLPDASPDGIPLTLRLSPKTLYRANENSADLSAFAQGMEVVVITRGLPNGMLEAVSVFEAGRAQLN